ncbi:MAG TPA: hypothetical protein VF230_14920 [Acidimicrobiales bacterium]
MPLERRDARALVVDPRLDAVLDRPRADPDRRPDVPVARRVLQQVRDHLLDERVVAVDQRQVVGNVELDATVGEKAVEPLGLVGDERQQLVTRRVVVRRAAQEIGDDGAHGGEGRAQVVRDRPEQRGALLVDALEDGGASVLLGQLLALGPRRLQLRLEVGQRTYAPVRAHATPPLPHRHRDRDEGNAEDRLHPRILFVSCTVGRV